jgi:hypothetical protein
MSLLGFLRALLGPNQSGGAAAVVTQGPHPANVPGVFYVEDGCCMACGVPEDVAPELFGWIDDANHCFVKRQPVDDAEFAQMLAAIQSAEAFCIRARNCPERWARQIRAVGEGDQIDSTVPDA